MGTNRFFLLITLAITAAYQTVYAAGDPTAGEAKTQTCLACHGDKGISMNPTWPVLAAQHSEYVEKQLHDFRTGARENAQMSPMAAPLTEQDIADLAAYYSAQSAPLAAAKPANLELGERVYRAGDAGKGLAACMACHGPSGAGNPAARYPRLAGQHAEYTAIQLKAFKAEQRGNDTNSVMRTIARKMTNEEIDAVSNYIQGLH